MVGVHAGLLTQANPDTELQRSQIIVGGEPAVLLDDIHSYDVLRKVVVIHSERLYVLTFVPRSESAQGFPRVADLYETIVSTFEFPGEPGRKSPSLPEIVGILGRLCFPRHFE